MEVAGAKVLKLDQGRILIIGVASTILNDNTAREILRAERVCRTKALANVIAHNQGVQVAHLEELEERTEIVLDGKHEKGSSVSEYLNITQAKTEGVARDLPVIGRWKSKDGGILYLAIGAFYEGGNATPRKQ